MAELAGIRLRPAAHEDLDWLVALEHRPENAAFVDQWPRREHAETMGQLGFRYLIAEIRGRPAGYAILAGLGTGDGALELRRIAVDRPGEGTGAAMLAAIGELAFRTFAAPRIWLDVYQDNHRAHAAYRRAGYATTGERDAPGRRADGGGRGLLIMTLQAPGG